MSSWAQENLRSPDFSEVTISSIFEDSISIRAIVISDETIYYAGTQGKYGYLDFELKEGFRILRTKRFKIKEENPSFRAIATTSTHFFLLSIESPALLYKVEKNTGEARLVYREDHKKAFYDAMIFWDDLEGIAMGDPTDSCLSVIITRDGGGTWKKVSCENLPNTVKGEAAFAASNSNIVVDGDHTWIISGGIKSRVFYSPDKGKSWRVTETPIIQGSQTTGAYSIDFYDKKNGIIFGGDYTKPDWNKNNKAITSDGGKTWNLVAMGEEPGYKSCVRYVPNRKAKELVAVGFTGLSFSQDSGNSWKTLSKEGFYTLRFINDSLAVGAGKNKIFLIKFK